LERSHCRKNWATRRWNQAQPLEEEKVLCLKAIRDEQPYGRGNVTSTSIARECMTNTFPGIWN
jgi:hypothetical protein